jgi:Tol biopolymer transport system component
MNLLLSFVLAQALPAQAAGVSVAAKGHAYNPAWSADGHHIAFELNQYEGNVDLYVVNLQNGTPVGTPGKVALPGASSSFASGGSVAGAPSWHPQGPLIFEGSNAGGTTRLYFWQPGGGAAAELLSTQQISGDLSWPTIANDGNTVAFVSDVTGKGDLYLWDRSGNVITKAVSSPFSEMSPRFDDASKRVAFSRRNNGSEDLFVYENGGPTPRTGGSGDQSRPVWSGDKIVFFSNERGDDHWDVAVSAGVGDKQVIARDVRLPLRATPALSPDGQWVAWGASKPEDANAIHVTRLDGSKTIKVDTGLVATGEPALTTVDGRTFLAFTALPKDGADWRQLHVIDITGKLH